MSVFDDIERVDIEPANHLISRADYLNASARPAAANVRAFIDGLVAQYPAPQRDEMARRLRSRDDRLHRSAAFELLLYGLLLRRGFAVLEIEPELPGGRAPDFLVADPAGREFFLEATVAEGEAGADRGADRRMREVLQALDDVQSPNFFLDLHHRGAPMQPVGGVRPIATRLRWTNRGQGRAALSLRGRSTRPRRLSGSACRSLGW